jgi:hypothetical protein
MSEELTPQEDCVMRLFRRVESGQRVLSLLSIQAHMASYGLAANTGEIIAGLLAKDVLTPIGDFYPGRPPQAYALTEHARRELVMN